MNRDHPLGLPPGSVRAVLAGMILAVWAALELGAGAGPEAPDAVRALAAGVAAGYGIMRTRAQEDTPPAPTPLPARTDEPGTGAPYVGEHHAR